MEEKLTEIFNFVKNLSANKKYDVEYLTYLAGMVLGELILKGCPINNKLSQIQEIVDDWADSQKPNIQN